MATAMASRRRRSCRPWWAHGQWAPGGWPHPRRRARRHHALLSDQHGDLAHARPQSARSLDRAARARASIVRQRRTAADSRSTRTTWASCEALCPRIRKTTWRNDAPARRPEPSSPMRASHVPNVRDRRPAELRRPGHSPTRHDKLALVVRPRRMIGAIWSGKIAGNSGRLPVRSCGARNQSRIAAWPFVRL